MTNPELEISTSVSSLLLSIQRVELKWTPIMEHFCIAMWLLEPQAKYVFVASHLSQIFIYLYIIKYICEQQRLRQALYVVSPMCLLPNEDKI